MTTSSEPETLAVGRALARLVRAGDAIALNGPLGAGKTRLVRGLAAGLGIDTSLVSSPTYVVVNEYPIEDALGTDPTRPRRLLHADAYRLSGPDDLDSLGWDRVTDGSGVVVVEWADRLGDPADWAGGGGEPSLCRVRIEPTAESTRTLEVTVPPAWRSREGWSDLMRLATLVGDRDRDDATPAPLPRGWARCPTTGHPVPPDAPTFPFADERARMADLGKWLTGQYTVSREIVQEDLDDPDLGPAR